MIHNKIHRICPGCPRQQDTSRTLSDHQGYTHEDVTGHVSPELRGPYSAESRSKTLFISIYLKHPQFALYYCSHCDTNWRETALHKCIIRCVGQNIDAGMAGVPLSPIGGHRSRDQNISYHVTSFENYAIRFISVMVHHLWCKYCFNRRKFYSATCKTRFRRVIVGYVFIKVKAMLNGRIFT